MKAKNGIRKDPKCVLIKMDPDLFEKLARGLDAERNLIPPSRLLARLVETAIERNTLDQIRHFIAGTSHLVAGHESR